MPRNPLLFTIVVLIIIAIQIAAAYMSARALLGGEVIQGFLYFLFVLLFGFFVAFYYTRYRELRRRKKPE